jgi:hypothetical protein
MSIIKVANFEGYWFNCSKCGREIKHAYAVKGMAGVYGSECVKGSTAEQDSRMRIIGKMLKNKVRYSWYEYCEAHGYTEGQMIAHYLRNGSLS